MTATAPPCLKELGVYVDKGTGELYTDNISKESLRCDCEECKGIVAHKMDAEALAKFDTICSETGCEIKSAYRCKMHEQELRRKTRGPHYEGVAVDFKVKGGAQRMSVIRQAIFLGCSCVGVGNSFVHVDFRKDISMAWKC